MKELCAVASLVEAILAGGEGHAAQVHVGDGVAHGGGGRTVDLDGTLAAMLHLRGGGCCCWRKSWTVSSPFLYTFNTSTLWTCIFQHTCIMMFRIIFVILGLPMVKCGKQIENFLETG